MAADEATDWGVAACAQALRTGRVSSRELAQAHLARIERADGAIGAFLAVTGELALQQADAADRRRARGEDGPLLGVPYALKDILTTAGTVTTAGSRLLEAYVPPDSSTCYERLTAAGAVLLGKTNLDEFAMGSSTENSAFHATRNPWDHARVPGGSSGGSAAAVAARMAPLALGTDTGGSIRQPAALCGCVGVKPTYGRVSRYGLIAFGSSLDCAGPFARSSADAATVLAAIAGHDPRDATSLDAPVPDYAAALVGDLDGLRVGVVREHLAEGLDDGVRAALEAALDVLVEAGAERVPVSLPHVGYSVASYYLVATAECSANLARYDGIRYGRAAPADTLDELLARTRDEGLGAEVKRRIMLGTYALSRGYFDAYYKQATRVRGRVRADFDAALEDCDVLVGPTVPAPAFRLGEKRDDPLAMYLSDIYTIALNLAGLPGASTPCGLVDGLPVGLQIMGRPLDEATVLRVADAYERRTDWAALRPPEGGAP